MKTVYVLMYRSNEEFVVDAAKRETAFGKPMPYAVFEDSITAEKMKRDGDEIVEVPYFEDKKDNSNLYTTSPHSITVPCSDHMTVTNLGTTHERWGKESTTAEPPSYNTYPKVTCNKTVDEHTWRDRSD